MRILLQNASQSLKTNIDDRKEAFVNGNKVIMKLREYQFGLLEDELWLEQLRYKSYIAGN